MFWWFFSEIGFVLRDFLGQPSAMAFRLFLYFALAGIWGAGFFCGLGTAQGQEYGQNGLAKNYRIHNYRPDNNRVEEAALSGKFSGLDYREGRAPATEEASLGRIEKYPPGQGHGPSWPLEPVPSLPLQRVSRGNVRYHVGIVTGQGPGSGEERAGALAVMAAYGSVEEGGIVRLVSYPDNFMAEIDETSRRIMELAGDPLLKAIVVNPAVPGTAEAFRQVRQRRPDIVLLAGQAHEDPAIIGQASNLTVSVDFIKMGYLIPYAAKMMGADTLVHISFPRHLLYESIGRRRAIMEKAAQDLGLRFFSQSVPDPLGQSGLAGSRDFLAGHFPLWLEEYGPRAAFFSSAADLSPALIGHVASQGGYYVVSGQPSPNLGYPGALGEQSSRPDSHGLELVGKLEARAKEKGLSGRIGTWPFSSGYCHTAGLFELARMMVEDSQILEKDPAALNQAFRAWAPQSRWSFSRYFPSPGQPQAPNYLLSSQDVYVLGRGFLGLLDVSLPQEYRDIPNGPASRPSQVTFRIGIVSGPDHSQDESMGAQEIIGLYGHFLMGGLVRQTTLPAWTAAFPEEQSKLIEQMASDPLIKVIVVSQAGPGTPEGFRRVKARRPDILLIAGQVQETSADVLPQADLVVTLDYRRRGYFLPLAAKLMGARKLVHLSFPRHMAIRSIALRQAIMKRSAEALGLEFISLEVADPLSPPLSEAGPDGPRPAIASAYPGWIREYGRETAFFSTTYTHVEPLVRSALEHGGYIPEPSLPSPLDGFAAALGFDRSEVANLEGRELMEKLSARALELGAGGRLGNWTYSAEFSLTAGLAEFGKEVIEGRHSLADGRSLLEALRRFTPGVEWHGSFYMDQSSGKPVRKLFLVQQDTYVLGRGYLGLANSPVPAEYFREEALVDPSLAINR
jgi:hypothetical protein